MFETFDATNFLPAGAVDRPVIDETPGRGKYRNVRKAFPGTQNSFIARKANWIGRLGLNPEINKTTGAARVVPQKKKKPPTVAEIFLAMEAAGKYIPPHMQAKIRLRREMALIRHFGGEEKSYLEETATILATIPEKVTVNKKKKLVKSTATSFEAARKARAKRETKKWEMTLVREEKKRAVGKNKKSARAPRGKTLMMKAKKA